MEGIYRVNLIPSDLGTEESILQIADTLENLNGIIDDVFSKLMRRISRNTEKTEQLKERIELSRLKVEKLTGMQKAIKVFSSAKYPASITHEHYQSVFDLDCYRHEPKKVVLSGKTQGHPSDKGIQEKLHFYHVKVAPPKTLTPKPDFDLNAVINNISSIGELLVFNTDESPYLGTVSKTAAHVPRVPVSDDKSLLEAAPSSIVKRDMLRRDADEYMYAPGMGLVPELEMPLDLPHLPGVAGDLQFFMTNDGSIAPSVVTSPQEPMTEARCITDNVKNTDLPKVEENLENMPEIQTLSDISVNLPEVPDVPDIPDVPEMPGIPDAPPPPSMMPPPPPPPPPPPMTMEPVPAKGTNKPAPVADAHSSLMAAIRQAGGAGRAKLRSAADTETAPETPPSTKLSSGNFMEDLRAKLEKRRQGISGDERRAERGGTVLHALQRIIPEPGETTSQGSSSDDDRVVDWE